MIDVLYPNTDPSLWFVGHDACLRGPFTIDGEYAMDDILFNAFDDTFIWSKGFLGENNVQHNRVTGQIVYSPSAEGFTPNPTCTTCPTLCKKGPALHMAGNKIVTLEAHFGFNPLGLIKQRSSYRWPRGPADMDQWVFYWADLANGRVESYDLTIYSNDYRRIYSWTANLIEDLHYDKESRVMRATWLRGQVNTSGSFIRSTPLEINENTMRNLPAVLDAKFVEPGTISVYRTNSAMIAYRINGTLNLSPKQVVDVVKDKFLKSLPQEEEDEPHIYQSLVARAVNQVDYRKLNIFEFIQGFTNPKQLIPKLLTLGKLSKLKDIAGDYLSYIYGILPTINDLGKILDYFRGKPNYYDRNGFIVYTARESKSTDGTHDSMETVWRAKIAIDEEDPRWLVLRKQYDSLGRLPTFSEIWDLVPYSFVIDWFVSIGTMLESLQAEGWRLRLPIRYYTYSKKSVTNVSETLVDGTVHYNLTRTNYRRWVTDQCPSVFLPPEFETTFLDRWVEGAALIIARKR